MPAAYVPMDIDQGEDFTSDVVWTDDFNDPVLVKHPCRLDVKSRSGQVICTFETDPDIPDGEIPTIALSADIGLLQLHQTADVTAALTPGKYDYDLFASSDDGDEYAGNQVTRLIYGPCTVHKRVTEMT